MKYVHWLELEVGRYLGNVPLVPNGDEVQPTQSAGELKPPLTKSPPSPPSVRKSMCTAVCRLKTGHLSCHFHKHRAKTSPLLLHIMYPVLVTVRG